MQGLEGILIIGTQLSIALLILIYLDILVKRKNRHKLSPVLFKLQDFSIDKSKGRKKRIAIQIDSKPQHKPEFE